MLSGRGLCDGLITRPEESYRLWRVVVCDQEISNEDAIARYGAVKNTTKRVVTPRKQTHTNRIGNDALHDLTLIQMITNRFVDTTGFLTRYSYVHTK